MIGSKKGSGVGFPPGSLRAVPRNHPCPGPGDPLHPPASDLLSGHPQDKCHRDCHHPLPRQQALRHLNRPCSSLSPARSGRLWVAVRCPRFGRDDLCAGPIRGLGTGSRPGGDPTTEEMLGLQDHQPSVPKRVRGVLRTPRTPKRTRPSKRLVKHRRAPDHPP